MEPEGKPEPPEPDRSIALWVSAEERKEKSGCMSQQRCQQSQGEGSTLYLLSTAFLIACPKTERQSRSSNHSRGSEGHTPLLHLCSPAPSAKHSWEQAGSSAQLHEPPEFITQLDWVPIPNPTPFQSVATLPFTSRFWMLFITRCQDPGKAGP